jgi:hypothetical protein
MISKFSFSKKQYQHLNRLLHKVYLYNNNFKLMSFIGIYDFRTVKGFRTISVQNSSLKGLFGRGLNYNWRIKFSWLFLLSMLVEKDSELYSNYFKTLLTNQLLQNRMPITCDSQGTRLKIAGQGWRKR